MDDPKWKKFEKLAYSIQKELAKDADIKLDDYIIGKNSQKSRQIDISIRQTISPHNILIVIDCKDYKTPIDVNIIEEFATKLRDVMANKGAIISASGFTEAAINIASAYGIDTFRLIDTKNIVWKSYASIPVLIKSTFLKAYQLIFKDFQSLPVNMDYRFLNIFDDKDNDLGAIENIITKKWENNEIKHEPGQIEVLIGENVFIKPTEEKIKATIIARCIIGQEFYLGNVPVHLRGFQDMQKGGVVTRSFTTEHINFSKIRNGKEENWRKIEDPQKLATKPFLVLYMSN